MTGHIAQVRPQRKAGFLVPQTLPFLSKTLPLIAALQREAGDPEAGIADKFLVSYLDGTKEWCVLSGLRCMIEADTVWARVEGQPWMPGRCVAALNHNPR